MKTIKVKEMMVPLTEYATVSEDATLYEAISELEKAQEKLDRERAGHRAILVRDKENRILGKIGLWDILKGLEPRYERFGNLRETSRYGFSPEFISSMLDSYGLWRKPLDDLCRKAGEMSVKNLVCTPSEGEYVDEDATLDQAIHQLVMGHHQSLLVTKGEDIVGVLRLIDVFMEISSRIKKCGIPSSETS